MHRDGEFIVSMVSLFLGGLKKSMCERPSLINGRVSLRNSLFRPNARISKTTNTKTINLFIQKSKK